MTLNLNETKAPYYADLTVSQQQVVQSAIEILEARMKQGEPLLLKITASCISRQKEMSTSAVCSSTSSTS